MFKRLKYFLISKLVVFFFYVIIIKRYPYYIQMCKKRVNWYNNSIF